MELEFASYLDFKEECNTYHFDECSACGAFCEILETNVRCTIEDKHIYFPEMLVLKCLGCGKMYLTEYSKRTICSAYELMKRNHTNENVFARKTGHQERFDYCVEQDYKYDYRDYYSIPGLCYDEEHTRKGFLTPVYFEKEALVYFLAIPSYTVNLFSETYGYIEKNENNEVEWQIPFGFNSRGKWVMWLGDIEDMDQQTRNIIKPFNIESDHLLVNSEFYQAQMKCVFSQPIIESRILRNKDAFIKNIKEKYVIDISHLTNECRAQEANIRRPVVFTEQTVSVVINAYDKILVEGFDPSQMRTLYETLYSPNERDRNYRTWQSIKLIQALLTKLGKNIPNININLTMSPLYILHDYRIYFDHLLSESEREESKKHILDTLGVQDFSDQKAIYREEINRLDKLFNYLAVLSK